MVIMVPDIPLAPLASLDQSWLAYEMCLMAVWTLKYHRAAAWRSGYFSFPEERPRVWEESPS